MLEKIFKFLLDLIVVPLSYILQIILEVARMFMDWLSFNYGGASHPGEMMTNMEMYQMYALVILISVFGAYLFIKMLQKTYYYSVLRRYNKMKKEDKQAAKENREYPLKHLNQRYANKLGHELKRVR